MAEAPKDTGTPRLQDLQLQSVGESVRSVERRMELLEQRTERLGTIERVLDRIDRQTQSVEEKIAKSQNDPKEKKQEDWVAFLTRVGGIGAILILAYLQFGQGQEARSTATLREAEVGKVEAETAKLQADVLLALEQLKEKQAAGAEAQRKVLDETLPRLQEGLTRLQELNAGVQARIAQDNITRYLLLWVFLMAVGLFFTILSTVWSSVLSVLTSAIYTVQWGKIRRRWVARDRRDWGDSDNRENERLERRVRAMGHFVLPILSPLPTILHVAVEVALFGAVLIPLFNQLATSLGSPVTFGVIVDSLWRFDFATAIDSIRQVIFS